jgi:uncharacterized protein with GYD domain
MGMADAHIWREIAAILAADVVGDGCARTRPGRSRSSRFAVAGRAEAQEIGKKLGVEVKAGFSAMGAYDLILHVEAPSDDALSKWALSIASRGNIRTNTIKVYPAAEFDTIIAGIL